MLLITRRPSLTIFGMEPKLLSCKDEVGDVSRGVAARSDGHGAVGLLHGEDVVDAVARHGDRVARLFNGAD